MAEEKKSSGAKWIIIILVIVILGFISLVLAAFISVLFTIGGSIDSGPNLDSGNVAIIPIKGVILTEVTSSPFGGTGDTSSKEIVDLIEKAENNPGIKAIVFEINSPGGSGVASDEIATAIKKAKKPTISYVREVGASGAYWVASATDKIYANRMSIVGSIGVIGSFVEFSGLMERYNITYQRFVAGKYKDFGSPMRSPSEEEKDLYQEKLDMMHKIFISEVANNRNMTYKEVEKLATGFIFTGQEAVNNRLIDDIGGKDEVEEYLQEKLNMSINFVEYKRKRTLLDMLSEVSTQNSYGIGKGIGASFIEEGKRPGLTAVFT